MNNRKIYFDTLRWMKFSILFQFIYDIASIASVYVLAIYLGKTTDAALNGQYELFLKEGKTLLLCLFISVIAIPFLAVMMDFVSIKSGSISDIEVCSKMAFWKYNKLKGYDEGEIEYKLSAELCEFRIIFATMCSNLLTIPVFFVFVIYCERQLGRGYTLISLVCNLIILVFPILLRKVLVRYDRDKWKYEENQNQIYVQISEWIKTISLYELQRYFLDRWHHLFNKYFSESRKKANRISNILRETEALVKVLSQLIILFLGCYLVQQGSITTGSIIIMLQYFTIFDTFLAKIVKLIMDGPKLKEKAARLQFLYDDMECDGGKNIPAFITSIKCDNLSYRYGDKDVIRNLNFHIKSGEKIQIIGDNGSGKSTLVSLLCGLDLNFEGDIIINGLKLKEINLNDWRNKIGVVFQDDYVIPGTVLENINIGNLLADKEQIEEVKRNIGLPDILEKMVGYGANEISGGEKKKIGIARATLKNAELLIIDEGDSHLDDCTRKKLYHYIVSTNQTVIYISHDTGFSELADQTIQMR